MNPTLEIIEADLDKALLAVKHSHPSRRTSVCLLAQAVIRQIGAVRNCGWGCATLVDGRVLSIEGASVFVSAFDHGVDAGDVSELRAKLPVTLEYSFDSAAQKMREMIEATSAQ